jgi:hypothetical protein
MGKPVLLVEACPRERQGWDRNYGHGIRGIRARPIDTGAPLRARSVGASAAAAEGYTVSARAKMKL